MSAEQHNSLCDCLDINPDGIRKPCNCGAELSVDAKRRLRQFARECIRNSGGDPDDTANNAVRGAAEPRTLDGLVGDPFCVLPLDAIREVRNEALTHSDGDTFVMHGFTFVMPGALMRANTRLMLANKEISIAPERA